MSKKPVVNLALFALLSTPLAACGGGGSMSPAMSAAPAGIMPAVQPRARPAADVKQDSIQTSGSVAGLNANGFTLQTGYPHGYINVATSSSTTFAGAKPYVGESVSVSGTGSFSTSIVAVTVTQAGSLQTSGSISSVASGGFTLQTGYPHGNVRITTSSSTTFTGSKPFLGENVSVSGSGSFSASINAIAVTQAGASSTPSPSPVPTVTPRPTAVPTEAPLGSGSGVAGAVKLFQIFDFSTTASQSTSAAKSEAAVWGAGVGDMGASPSTWLAGNGGLAAIQYVVQPVDHNAVSHHNLAWFQANHPDWIVYDCDTNNQPTNTVAYQPGLPSDVPLDIHNPDAVKYQIETAANFAIAHGANAIGADQTLFFDYDGGQQPGWYGCGIYENGTFVRRWGSSGGGFPNHDPQWNRDVAAWAVTAKQVLTTDATLSPHHIKLFVNHPAGNISDVNEQTLIANVDGILDETGFIDYGNYPTVPSLFTTALSYMEYVQRQGKMVLENAKFSGSLVGDSTNFGLTQSQVAYAMSTYLIGNEGNASLFITPGPYGALYNFSQIATINAQLGTSCGSYTTAGSAYVRKFTHGMVVVNPSTATTSVSLGGVYSDVFGRAVSGTTLTVGPATGYVLLGTGGC